MDDLDEFSDDGLDELADNALQELENKAIQFTQVAQVQRPQDFSQQPQQDYDEYSWVEDDDLDTTEVTNNVGVVVGRPVVDQTLQQHPQLQQQQQPVEPTSQRRTVPPVPNPRWNPAIDPADRPVGGITARPHALNAGTARHAVFPSQTVAGSRPQPSQFARPPLAHDRFAAPSQNSQAPSGNIVSAMQQRVRVLESELNAARGEASIIRTNSVKAQQLHDAEVNRLKKLNAEQMSKQGRVVDAAVAAERSANTELQFLQRDIREVNDRARRKDTATTSGPGHGAATSTPKKTRSWGFADGFDEMDIVASPSKGHGRTRNAGSVAANVGERTPSKGKRKRPMIDSPVMALDTHTDDVEMAEARPVPTAPQPLVTFGAPALPFEFLQLVLDHGYFHEQPPTFDMFSRFAFPSDPSTSFAAIIFQKLPLMGSPQRPMQLLVDFCELVLSLWTRCFEEKYWQPIQYLVALISFTFDLHTTSVAPLMVPNLVIVAQATVGMVAEGRHRAPAGGVSVSEEYRALEQNVDTAQILSVLHTAASACAATTVETEHGYDSNAFEFWRLVSLDFALLLLTPKQNLIDVVGMLDLLAGSSLPGSIGPITDDEVRDNVFVARAIIERVSAKLTENARFETTPEQKRSVRLAALRTLISFARFPFGATQLASHDNALPRLVTCLSASIDDLYDQFLSPTFLLPLPNASMSDALQQSEPDPNARLNRIISQCVLLIHTLVTGQGTSDTVDISHKLSLSHGGSQRYLIALGRLTFAEEDLVLESGIESEVVEAAHELLEMAVTPDEGELVGEAFGA